MQGYVCEYEMPEGFLDDMLTSALTTVPVKDFINALFDGRVLGRVTRGETGCLNYAEGWYWDDEGSPTSAVFCPEICA